MKIHILTNGSLKMLISPETEIEKMQLDSLFKTPVDAKQMGTVRLIDIDLQDCVIIQPKTEQK